MKLPASLHQMLRDTLVHTRHVDDTFLLEKIDDRYESVSYGEVIEKVNAVSAFLLGKGFKKGDRMALILENCTDYIVLDQALMQIGGVNTSIYPTLPESEIAYILKDSGARVVVAGNPFLLKKVLKSMEGLEGIDTILIRFERSKAKSEDPRIISLDEVYRAGREQYADYREQIETVFHRIGPADLAALIYTSGTTGVPKGVMLTHENFMSNAWMAQTIVPSICKDDRFLSFLPLCHVYERLATYYLSVYAGCQIAFAQSIDSIAANMIEVQPTIMTTVPRLLERVKDRVIRNAESKGSLSRKIFYWAQSVGQRRRIRKEKGQWIDPWTALRFALADALVFKKVRARLGGKMRLLVSGGAALPKHVGEFFGNMGINALEGFGLTETSPLISINLEGEQVYGTVGRIVPGLKVGIVNRETGAFLTIQTYDSYDPGFECAEGEIVVKGPSVMSGYWNKPEETAAVIDGEGWFHTGDVGKFHKGNLQITDRIKNMLVSSYGKNIYPTPVENVYLKSPRIEQIFLIGDKREFITAIVVPPRDLIKEQFRRGDGFFDEADPFIREEEIIAWVGEDIRRLSGELAKFERIRNFAVKRNPFTIESGEITPTLKTKRRVIESRYAQEIEKLYEAISEEG